MKWSFGRVTASLLIAALAMLAVGATSALAHGGRGGGALKSQNNAVLVTEAAKQLGVTSASLRAAITKAARARIAEAVEDDEVEADEVDELEERAQNNLRFAMSLSRTRVVASNLGITAAKLNTGFRAARKALIIARIDEAVEDGDIDADEAAELKEELDSQRLPGYKPFGGGLRGLGFGCP